MPWLHKAVGNWHCLLLEVTARPGKTTWPAHRAANAALGVPIRCAPGSWDEEEAEEEGDRWLQVTTEGVSEILWRT